MGIKYEPSLDGVRALAVTAVLLSHSHAPGFAGGGRGVDMFFVLSGYLITRLLEADARAGRIDFAAFWRRRAARLMPALLLLVTAYVALAPLLLPTHAPERWRDALLALSYTMNYALADQFRVVGLSHTWSLAVEAHFYLLWPLALPLILRLKQPALFLLVVWAVLTALRAVAAVSLPWTAVYHPTQWHATGLVLGAALALWRAPAWLAPVGLAVLAALLTVVVPAGGTAKLIYVQPLVELATAALMAGLVQPTLLTGAFSWEPIRRLGLVSYGVYLWHWPVALMFHPLPTLQRVLLTAVVSIGLATLSYVTVEKWGRSWRARRPVPAPSPALPPAPG